MGARSSQSRGPGLNETDGHLLEYFRNTFGAGGGGNSGPNVPIPTPGITATGGVISDYTSGSDVYRAHVFNSSGIFDVSALSQNPAIPDTVEYLVVAGGGSGGAQGAGSGGGGAGGLRTNLAGHPLAGATFPVSTSPGEYTVTIGAGAVGATGTGYGNNGSRGTPSVFGSITSTGGGGGGTSSGGSNPVGPGGSGGGRGGAEPGTAYTGNTPPVSPSQGFAGGIRPANYYAGGGGGAGAVGQNGQPDRGGAGGTGVQVAIAGPTATTFTGVGAKNPSNNQYQYFAGGGGGGAYPSPAYQASGGLGGGAAGGYAPDNNGKHGEVGNGGGGGGADGNGPTGGASGSGIVIVRYKIGVVAGTAKATGGSISFYSNKTIHTFTGSGTFATEPNWSSATVEYVVIAGGGSGGSNAGAGGGAGAYRTGSTPIGAHPVSTSIQVGAGGVGNPTDGANSSGTPSYFGSPITSPGGGKGANSNASGTEGGSGGAGSSGGNGTGDPFPGTIQATPANGWGNNGGNQSGSGASRCGGGGGGAGGDGSNGSAPDGGGNGGSGVQLPSTFRDPASSVGGTGPTSALTNGDTSGKYWVAGGGGGSSHHPGGHPGGSGGGAPPSISPYSTPWSGGGAGGKGNYPNFTDPERFAKNGEGGTGGGGGASAGGGSLPGGFGGSGLVLVAYPT